MQEHKPVAIFIECLNRSGVEYMVTGSIASIIYGQPRMTHDVDIVLNLHISDVNKFIEQFPLTEFYCPPKEVITLEIAREFRGHFNLIHHKTGFKADIYAIGDDKLHKWAMQNKRKFNFAGCPVWVAPAEYVIIRKLEYYKEGGSTKHITDIKNILQANTEIDELLLAAEIEKLNLQSFWQEIKL